ncbi:MAG: ABC transporter ATP-binding protein [Clostridia bacterium]|nr:ABC transporter ATP-binding protein [Clostridia bacterium]
MEESAKHLIEITDVHKRFLMGDTVVEALKGVSLTVDEGEFLGILGPSGSGKSTLMNVVGCMDTFQEGSYKLLGIPVESLGDDKLTILRNRLIGFIFQKYHLIPKYTVLQNVMMPLLSRGMRYEDAARIALEKLRMLDMEKRLAHKPNELSGGQQQRAAIARALVGNPKLLLADEPTGALDSKTGKEVLKLFQALNDQGHTIVMITHDLSVAKSAGRIVRIIDGELYKEEAT